MENKIKFHAGFHPDSDDGKTEVLKVEFDMKYNEGNYHVFGRMDINHKYDSQPFHQANRLLRFAELVRYAARVYNLADLMEFQKKGEYWMDNINVWVMEIKP